MESIISFPYFPYPRWIPCDQSDFNDSARKVLYVESKNKCMFPGCKKGLPHDRLECHHIVPKRFKGQGDPSNGIVFCAGHHELADRCIITPDACLRFKKGDNPYLDLSPNSLLDLADLVCSLSEFSQKKVLLRPEEEWNTICSILMSARDSTQRDLPFCYKICAWALSVMAGFCVSHMQGGRTERMLYHPRKIIDNYALESDLYNEFVDPDDFLSVHNLHHLAVNNNALLDFNTAAKTIEKAQKRFSQLALDNVHRLMPINLVSYGAYLTGNQISILAKAGYEYCMEIIGLQLRTINHLSEEDTADAWPKYLLASILLDREKDADYFAERAGVEISKESWVSEASRFRVLAAWAIRKGKNHYNEAEEFIKQSLEIATRENLGHQLGKTIKLKSIMEKRNEQLSFAKGHTGSIILRDVL